MPKICYVERKFSTKSLKTIRQANEIIAAYMGQGYILTLRQLYYQFVARDLIPNTMKSYKGLGSVINDARLAGLIDWSAVEDRTRNLSKQPSWGSPQSIIDACASQFRIDKWEGQIHRAEVWIEKEALAGVFEGVCNELQVPFLCCRGYTSQSEMWGASERLKSWMDDHSQNVVILHFGDHDPSGMDMSRDIRDRLRVFGIDSMFEFKRLALNMEQVEQYNPPPNPAKTTDSRYATYIREFGTESWELDALEPAVLAALVRDAIAEIIDQDKWDEKVREENEHKRLLGEVSSKWGELTDGL